MHCLAPLQRACNYMSVQRHDSAEDRQAFAEALQLRLRALTEKQSRQERLNEQIKRIDSRAQSSARDAVMLSGTSSDVYSLADEEEDLDAYVKRRMHGQDSNKPSPGQQQSPQGFKNRRRSPSEWPGRLVFKFRMFMLEFVKFM